MVSLQRHEPTPPTLEHLLRRLPAVWYLLIPATIAYIAIMWALGDHISSASPEDLNELGRYKYMYPFLLLIYPGLLVSLSIMAGMIPLRGRLLAPERLARSAAEGGEEAVRRDVSVGFLIPWALTLACALHGMLVGFLGLGVVLTFVPLVSSLVVYLFLSGSPSAVRAAWEPTGIDLSGEHIAGGG